MKNFAFFLLLFISGIASPSLGQNTYFQINYNVGFQSLPTYNGVQASMLPDIALVEKAFKFVKDSADIEFKYSYAGCEKRAHAISLLLKGKNIPHVKIWNFDPGIISLFNRKQEPSVQNMTGLSPSVNWPYHVAILVFAKRNNLVDTLVIDPAIANRLLHYKEWLKIQSPQQSYYTFLDPQWYSFVTINQYPYSGQPVPQGFPKLLTGDFYKNEGYSVQQLWVEEALAVNKVAMKIINDKINSSLIDGPKKQAYIKLLSSFDDITAALNGTQMPSYFSQYSAELTSYKQDFLAIRQQWKDKLGPLR